MIKTISMKNIGGLYLCVQLPMLQCQLLTICELNYFRGIESIKYNSCKQ